MDESLYLPPLRERPEDIVNLSEQMLAHFGSAYHRPGLALEPEAKLALVRHVWPGNIPSCAMPSNAWCSRPGKVTLGRRNFTCGLPRIPAATMRETICHWMPWRNSTFCGSYGRLHVGRSGADSPCGCHNALAKTPPLWRLASDKAAQGVCRLHDDLHWKRPAECKAFVLSSLSIP